jgi:hypothetical protein
MKPKYYITIHGGSLKQSDPLTLAIGNPMVVITKGGFLIGFRTTLLARRPR